LHKLTIFVFSEANVGISLSNCRHVLSSSQLEKELKSSTKAKQTGKGKINPNSMEKGQGN